MQAVGRILIDSVRRLDAEAGALLNGYHTGLVGSAVKPYEDRWTAQLASWLTEQGYPTCTQVRYPNRSRKRCDLVVEQAGKARAWTEVKIAWKAWFARTTATITSNNPYYRPYLLGPADGGLTRTHSLAQDFQKLLDLAPSADHKAILLIGFDAEDSPMSIEVDDLHRQLGLEANGWRGLGPEVWPDRSCARCRVCCWFWWHSAGC